MKAYVIVTLLAVSSISSVSSAMCMKKFLNSVGMNPTTNTNYYNTVKGKASDAAGKMVTVSSDSSKRQH